MIAKWEPSSSKSEWDDFEKRQTGEIVKRIDLYRRRREMTVEDLARKLDSLSWPVSLSTLNGILGGKRRSISVAEMFVFARALGVSPAYLLLPIETNGEAELSPGVTADALPAWSYLSARWMESTHYPDWLSAQEVEDLDRDLDALRLLLMHEDFEDYLNVLEDRLREKPQVRKKYLSTGEWQEFEDAALGNRSGIARGVVTLSLVESKFARLRDTRRRMSERSMRLPEISDTLSKALKFEEAEQGIHSLVAGVDDGSPA